MSVASTPGHMECPVHSACYSGGRYLPEDCSTCFAWLEELRGLPADQVQGSSAWGALRRHLLALREAVLSLTPRPVLRVPEELAAWFPSELSDEPASPSSQRSDSLRPPSGSGTPPVPEALTPAESSVDLSSRLSNLEAWVFQIHGMLGARPVDSSRPGRRPCSSAPREDPNPPSPKRFRPSPAAVAPQGWVAPAEDSAPARPAYSAGGEDDATSAWGDASTTGAEDPLPSAKQGWRLKPDTWVVIEEDAGLVGYFRAENQSFCPLTELEFRRHQTPDAVSYYYRVRVPASGSEASAAERVRRMSPALVSLSARVAGSPAPRPSIIPKKSGKYGMDLEIGGSPVHSLLSWSDLPSLWSVRAAGPKPPARDREESRLDARPFSLDWAPGTPGHALASFLTGPSASEATVPYPLTKPPAGVLKADSDSRSEAHRLYSVSTCLDVLSALLRAAVAMPQEWSSTDCRSFLATVAESVEGSAALLAPLTRDRVREAVFQRVAFREAAVPKEHSASKADLVTLEPLSPLPYGSLEGVASVVRSRAPPAEVVFPKSMEDLLRRQSHGYRASGSGSNKSSSKSGSGPRDGRDSRKSSPGASNRSSRRGDSGSSRSSRPFRGGGRGGGQRGGSGGSKQPKSDAKDSSSNKN